MVLSVLKIPMPLMQIQLPRILTALMLKAAFILVDIRELLFTTYWCTENCLAPGLLPALPSGELNLSRAGPCGCCIPAG